MPFQKLSITNEAGDELAARLDLPLTRQPETYALFAHCFTCSKDLKALGRISRRLLEIADKCPVHRTLEAGVYVNSSLIDD